MSGYTKLSSSIIHSTIWDEAMHVRIVWITMLALKDRHGEVMASVPGLAHAARVTLEQAQEALEKLKAPDPHSRTQDDDGRRVAVIDGGWLILNHAKYRDMESEERRREAAAIRQRRHREPARMERIERIAQQGVCPCCSKPFQEPFSKYVVQDHCHKTGILRDLICQSCNKRVGMFENQTPVNPYTDPNAAAYVERWSRLLSQQQDQMSHPSLHTDADTDSDSKNKEKSAPASASAPEVKKRRGRGVDTLEVPEVPDWVEGLAARLKAIWHKADPDGRPIDFRMSLLVQRLALIHAKQPLYTEQVLEDAAKDYLRSQRQRFKSAHYFFTTTKDPHSNDQPPFKEWVDTRVHRARAAAKAAAEAAGAPTSPEATP